MARQEMRSIDDFIPCDSSLSAIRLVGVRSKRDDTERYVLSVEIDGKLYMGDGHHTLYDAVVYNDNFTSDKFLAKILENDEDILNCNEGLFRNCQNMDEATKLIQEKRKFCDDLGLKHILDFSNDNSRLIKRDYQV